MTTATRWTSSPGINLHSVVNELIFSPVFGQLDPRQLAEWILRDGLKSEWECRFTSSSGSRTQRRLKG